MDMISLGSLLHNMMNIKESEIDSGEIKMLNERSPDPTNTFMISCYMAELALKSSKVDEAKQALKTMMSLANDGYAQAQLRVGDLYRDGDAGLPKDLAKAKDYWLKAATQKPYSKLCHRGNKILPNPGVAEAEARLGEYYCDGPELNRFEAAKWFARGAKHADASAQNNLGLFTLNGIGCAKDPKSARALFEKACAGTNLEASYNLADLMVQGVGGPKDVPKAIALMKKSVHGICTSSRSILFLQKLERDQSRAPGQIRKGRSDEVTKPDQDLRLDDVTGLKIIDNLRDKCLALVKTTDTNKAVGQNFCCKDKKTQGIVEALAFCKQNLLSGPSVPITVDDLEKIQMMVRKFDSVQDGYYRKDPSITIGEHFPPHPILVKFLMEDLANWISFTEASSMHPIQVAAMAHHKLVHLHPFKDGNGRTARILMNLILVRNGYPPANVDAQGLLEYSKGLVEADNDNLRPFLQFVSRCVQIFLQRIISNGLGIDDKEAMIQSFVQCEADKQNWRAMARAKREDNRAEGRKLLKLMKYEEAFLYLAGTDISQGDSVDALGQLAILFVFGLGCTPDPEQGKHLLLKAMMAGFKLGDSTEELMTYIDLEVVVNSLVKLGSILARFEASKAAGTVQNLSLGERLKKLADSTTVLTPDCRGALNLLMQYQDNNFKSCGCCGKVGVMKKCARCGLAEYCDRACQTSDWKVHAKICAKKISK